MLSFIFNIAMSLVVKPILYTVKTVIKEMVTGITHDYIRLAFSL